MPQNPFLLWLPPMIRLNIAPSNCLIEVPPGWKVQISNSTLLHMNLIIKFLQKKKKKRVPYNITQHGNTRVNLQQRPLPARLQQADALVCQLNASSHHG